MDESKVKEVLGAEVIMQSLLGKLYDILTMGEDGTPKSEDNFSVGLRLEYPSTWRTSRL